MNSLIQIENKSGKIKLNDVVMRPVMDDLIHQIGKIFGAKAAENGADFGEIMNCAENAVDTLDIEIHSPGGSVLDGYTLYHELLALRKRGVYVTATINSLAASMASVIAMGADKIRMVQGGRMMIHEVSKGTQGSADDHRKAAELLDSMSNEIADIYASKTGQPPKKMREMMKVETWMGAKDALDQKFIDEIIDIRNLESKPKAMSLLSKLFPGNDEVSKLEASIAQIDNLSSQIDNLTNEVSALKLDIVAKDQTIAENSATIGTLNETVCTLQAEAKANAETVAAKDAEIADLMVEIAKAKNSAADQAAAMLAQVGQPEPLEIAPTASSETQTITRAQFNELDHVARNTFIKSGGKIKDSI